MESHGGDVELLGIEDGVAKMRLVGHCKGCPASEATLELAIKKALEETAPDLEGLEVEGVREPAIGGFELPVVQSDGNGNGAGAPPAWTDLEARRRLPARTSPITVAGADCSSPTSAARCWPTATRAAGAGRGSTPRRWRPTARSPARRASGASSCAALGGRPTTTGSRSRPCRCCAARAGCEWRSR